MSGKLSADLLKALLTRGWAVADQIGDLSTVVRKGDAYLLIPIREDAADYDLRLWELNKDLTRIYGLAWATTLGGDS